MKRQSKGEVSSSAAAHQGRGEAASLLSSHECYSVGKIGAGGQGQKTKVVGGEAVSFYHGLWSMLISVS